MAGSGAVPEYPSMKANNPRRSRRMALCLRCKHAEFMPVAGVTCGTPLVGRWIEHEGESVHLCGCIMAVKTRLPDAVCPIKRW